MVSSVCRSTPPPPPSGDAVDGADLSGGVGGRSGTGRGRQDEHTVNSQCSAIAANQLLQ